MKKLNPFQQSIKSYLDQRAQEDALFAVSYAKEKKSIEECEKFIISEVQKSKRSAYTPDEVFGLAVHYYDEDDIKNIKAISCKVVVPSSSSSSSSSPVVELTEADKEQARLNAIEQLQKEEAIKMKARQQRKKPVDNSQQLSLF